uniref:Uncharacterized protein n=1 Tax=Trieres chinensis TaxID=1514140 RepID=A0A7S2A3E3_TRICV|mmetsp:Transcript_39059/g.79636  ORF Transcript_39059/g.79636 Transcript_39059/m.79636 type:complete len:191 (+) Transcript_39059:92-664(+)|eukprot:CAMPEP_0183325860 /NCGR_PEP_ID=MMETSP0160_2-20130417/80715_1 /TAXON_ID=2839 ORGANISM="Odontella Sinensis, Strain Grunow 1884" /NCGR_SAMPLE_ID=MMETSP0160_2 /ASSEMBLY_ACC=CAM_ASM_000250 /LENGTH=190 /DNA_ID=CAMNT_0025493741 /DNA_START=43 /DNA_END=615 /DNA_ORIENTATION=+
MKHELPFQGDWAPLGARLRTAESFHSPGEGPLSIVGTMIEKGTELPTKPSEKKRVRFHSVEVREYTQCLGDNPSCSVGPPISLDWNYHPHPESYALEDYEDHWRCKKGESGFRRSEENRIRLLLSLGYNYQDLLRADVEKTRDQLQRMSTAGMEITFKEVNDIFLNIRRKYLMKIQSEDDSEVIVSSAQA